MELTILQFFESIRSNVGDLAACFFSLFGETLFLVVLICLIYWVVDKKLGERLVLTSFSSMPVNGGIKSAVSRPRPFVGGGVTRVEIDNPLISTTKLSPYDSFPSGHSQMSAGLFFSSAFHVRKKWGWVIFPLLTLGVMLSRLYFGVHYPTDVIVGATLGIAFACFWEWMYRKHESKIYFVFALFALLSILLAILFPNKNQIELCACAVATAIFLPMENKFINFQNTTSAKNKFFRILVGILLVGIVYGAFSFLPFEFLEELVWKFVKYFLTVATATFFVPLAFKKLKI